MSRSPGWRSRAANASMIGGASHAQLLLFQRAAANTRSDERAERPVLLSFSRQVVAAFAVARRALFREHVFVSSNQRPLRPGPGGRRLKKSHIADASWSRFWNKLRETEHNS